LEYKQTMDALEIQKKLIDMEYEQNKKMISQKEEFAKYKRDRDLEDTVHKTEANNELIIPEIKVTSLSVLISIHSSLANNMPNNRHSEA